MHAIQLVNDIYILFFNYSQFWLPAAVDYTYKLDNAQLNVLICKIHVWSIYISVWHRYLASNCDINYEMGIYFNGL